MKQFFFYDMLFFCRHRTWIQERSFAVEKDQSKIKVHTDSTGEQDIKSHLGSPLSSPYTQSHIFSPKAKTRTNLDENKEDSRFVPDTFALGSDETKIQPDKLVQTSNIFDSQDESVRRKHFKQGSGQVMERLASHEPKRPIFSRGCDHQDPSVIIPNTAFHHGVLRPSIPFNSIWSNMIDDDADDDDDVYDYYLPPIDILLSSDEESDNGDESSGHLVYSI